MTDELRREELPYRVTQLLCRRTGQSIPPEEHSQCPYCFGREGEVATGIHARFCDYREGRDPKHFGFPEGTERDVAG
jgi:hypothetical protein